MNNREIAANTVDEYILYNHTSNFYTYQMQFDVIQNIKENTEKNILKIKTPKKLIKFLEDLVLEHFKKEIIRGYNLKRGYDLFNQKNINENTVKYLQTRNGEDFTTAQIKNVYDTYGDNFIFYVDNYYEEGFAWRNTLIEFYNIFINRFLEKSEYLRKYRVSAVFYTIDSTDGISVLITKFNPKDINIGRIYMSRGDFDRFEELNNNHQHLINEVINLKKIF